MSSFDRADANQLIGGEPVDGSVASELIAGAAEPSLREETLHGIASPSVTNPILEFELVRAQELLPTAAAIAAMFNFGQCLSGTRLAAKQASHHAGRRTDGETSANEHTIEIEKRTNAAGSGDDRAAAWLEHTMNLG